MSGPNTIEGQIAGLERRIGKLTDKRDRLRHALAMRESVLRSWDEGRQATLIGRVLGLSRTQVVKIVSDARGRGDTRAHRRRATRP